MDTLGGEATGVGHLDCAPSQRSAPPMKSIILRFPSLCYVLNCCFLGHLRCQSQRDNYFSYLRSWNNKSFVDSISCLRAYLRTQHQHVRINKWIYTIEGARRGGGCHQILIKEKASAQNMIRSEVGKKTRK